MTNDFDLKSIRKSLNAMRNKHGADTPTGHTYEWGPVMLVKPGLHKRLIARQSDAELERKAEKAWMRNGKLYTQEELDAADREAERLYAALHRS
jgi:hypothetical protein